MLPAGQMEPASRINEQLQQQLDAAQSELQQTRALLEQLMQEGMAAMKAACDTRAGSLRLLLVKQLSELREAEQQRVAAQQVAADKVCSWLCSDKQSICQ